MAEVQVRNDSGVFETIEEARWRVENGVSTAMPAPRASIETSANVDIPANRDVRIVEGSDAVFNGFTRTGGEYGQTGQQRVECRSLAWKILDEKVSVDLTNATDYDVISTALSNTELSADFSLLYPETPIDIGDYSADSREFQVILRDMMDRSGRVWWFSSDANTLNVQSLGYRGNWESLQTERDEIAITEWNDGDIATVQNDVTVTGTGSDPVSGSDEDTASISDYGRHSKTYSYRWITDAAQALDLASQLLIPDPLQSGKVVVSEEAVASDTWANLSNYSITLNDSARGIDSVIAGIEKQVIEEGRTTLHVGKGTGYGKSKINRDSQSAADAVRTDYQQMGGQVPGTDIEPESIAEGQIADLAISAAKIQADAVEEAKIQMNAITETKITDEAVTTPKVRAGAIDTGRLAANAVTADIIDAEAVTVGKFDPAAFSSGNFDIDSLDGVIITSGGVGANEIAAGSITADKINSLLLDTDQLEVGSDASYTIKFEENLGTVAMVPNTSGVNKIGDTGKVFLESHVEKSYPNRVAVGSRSMPGPGVLASEDIDANGEISMNNARFSPADSTTSDIVVKDDGGNVTIQPQTDKENRVGTINSAFDTMRATAFNVASPEPLAQQDIETVGGTVADGGAGERPVDLDELKRSSWYDPPQYVQDEQQRNLEKQDKGDDDDHAVELGHMGNYLLEVTKALAEERDALQERVDDLEARLDAVEAQLE